MNTLNISATEDTPLVMLDKAAGIFEIAGRSLPEDAAEFYAPIIDWLNEYSKSPNPSTILILKLEYFNTASSKLILDTLGKIENVAGIKIIWYYFEGDDDMLEAGHEFAELIEVPFEFKAY